MPNLSVSKPVGDNGCGGVERAREPLRTAVMLISRIVRACGSRMLWFVLAVAGLTANRRGRRAREGRPERRGVRRAGPVRRLAGQPRDLVVGRRDPGRLQPGI